MIINFTKAAIEALPVLDKRKDYQDAKTHGLYLRVTPTGIKSFSVLRRFNGKLERITIGQYPAISIDDARVRAGEINTAIAKGINPAEARRLEKSEMLFSDLFDEYLRRHSKPNKRTWKEDESKYKQYLAKPLGSKKVSVVSRADIARVHSDITVAGHPATANRVLALVSSIFGWSIAVGLYDSNPASGIPRNRENARDRFLQSDELPRFFRALDDEQNAIMRDFFLLALLTGARRSNVASMKWADISFERAEWRIQQTKNGTPQIVTLSPEAIDVLTSRTRQEKRLHDISSAWISSLHSPRVRAKQCTRSRANISS